MPAVYDNPDTGCREIYVHGHLVTYYSEKEIEYILDGRDGGTALQVQFSSYAESFGPYSEGQTFDDPTHLPADPLQANSIYLGDSNRRL